MSLILFYSFIHVTQAQSEIKSYSLKKGQAFDIIFLRTKEGTDEVRKKYFELAYPIALKMGYSPLKGYSIKENPLEGNYHPQSMILGSWPSIEVREAFLLDIEKEVPAFHSMRKEIWSNFDLTYWEIADDISFEVNTSKFNVVTAYWEMERAAFDQFKDKLLKASKRSGGRTVLQLAGGASPFGYEYNPDFVIITEWETKEAFEAFRKKSELDRSAVKLIHQFVI